VKCEREIVILKGCGSACFTNRTAYGERIVRRTIKQKEVTSITKNELVSALNNSDIDCIDWKDVYNILKSEIIACDL